MVIGIVVGSNDNCRSLVGDDNDIGDDIVELFPIEALPLMLVPRGKLRLCGFAGRVVAVTVLVVVPPTFDTVFVMDRGVIMGG